jgi:hypothetical protein
LGRGHEPCFWNSRPVLLLITGASGVGKSTVRAGLARELSPSVECVELGDLSPVPDPTAMTLSWRQQAAESAVRRAVNLQTDGRHLLLCGDPVPALEIVAAPSAPQLEAIAVCLLDADAEAQAGRLAARGDHPSLLPHHQAFAEWMRQQARNPLHMPHVVSEGGWDQMRWDRLDRLPATWGMHTIDTSRLTRAEVADATRDWCRRALAGDAVTISLG